MQTYNDDEADDNGDDINDNNYDGDDNDNNYDGDSNDNNYDDDINDDVDQQSSSICHREANRSVLVWSAHSDVSETKKQQSIVKIATEYRQRNCANRAIQSHFLAYYAI